MRPVGARRDAAVEDDHGPPVGGAPDQAAKALLETQHGLRKRELQERVLELLAASPENWIARRSERQPGNENAGQRLARQVEPLPEAVGAAEHRFGQTYESLHQGPPAARAAALGQDLDALGRQVLTEPGRGLVELLHRRQQHQRPAGQPARGLRHDGDEALDEVVLGRGGQVVGVMPRFLQALELAHGGLSELHVVEDMRSRKHEMLARSTAVVALPGGSGTLEELLEAVTLKRLGIFLGPIIICNISNYYAPLLAQLAAAVSERFMDERHASMWQVVASVDEVLAALESAPPWPASALQFANL